MSSCSSIFTGGIWTRSLSSNSSRNPASSDREREPCPGHPPDTSGLVCGELACHSLSDGGHGWEAGRTALPAAPQGCCLVCLILAWLPDHAEAPVPASLLSDNRSTGSWTTSLLHSDFSWAQNPRPWRKLTELRLALDTAVCSAYWVTVFILSLDTLINVFLPRHLFTSFLVPGPFPSTSRFWSWPLSSHLGKHELR